MGFVALTQLRKKSNESKKRGPKAALVFPVCLILALTLTVEAVAAIHRTVAPRLERNLRRCPAAIADHFVHLALSATAATARTALRTAARTTARLVLETLLSVKLLLRSGKYEFCATLTARQGFVFVHWKTS